jgi:hypothetical protein
MEISHKFIEQKMFSEHQLFCDQHKMFKEIAERGKAGIRIARYTKSTVSVSLYMGAAGFGMNFFDERFKTLKQTDHNYFTSESVTAFFFKTTKHQGLQELVEYVETAFRNICYDYEIQGIAFPKGVELLWEETEPIRELQIKQKQLV